MKAISKSNLWLRVAGPFLFFVVAGSLAIILFLQATYQRQSFKEFEQLAQANAEFVKSVHIPLSDRFADYLGRVLGVAVYFGDAPSFDDRHEAVTVPIEMGLNLTLVREKSSLTALLLRPASLGVLGAFWGLSLALAWAITRGVVLPYLDTQRRLVETERLALLGKMATALAHEIQNPVAAIRLHAQLLEPAEPETASLIVGEAATIESLVNQWMFLAKPEPPRTSAADLSELIASVVHALGPVAQHACVTVELNTPRSLPVCADTRRLGQAVSNVILNAIQAMPGGGTLRIAAERRDSRAVVTFADAGSGFSENALLHYADLFYSEKEGGMGIGLSVTSEILKAHHGAVNVANNPAGGAIVHMEIPLAKDGS